jgi:hypothetical protein
MTQMADTIDKPPDIDHSLYVDDVSPSLNDEQRILSDDLPSLQTVREMIKYETSLRLSDSVQELFDLYHNDDNAITYV